MDINMVGNSAGLCSPQRPCADASHRKDYVLTLRASGVQKKFVDIRQGYVLLRKTCSCES